MSTQTVPVEEYDLVVLGSGEGGKYVAWNLAKEGKRTAVIERRWIGGSCPNIACLPSKNIIHSAKIADYFRRSDEFGITKGEWKIEMPLVRDRKRKMVQGLIQMHIDIFAATGAELVLGSGVFVDATTIEVTNDRPNFAGETSKLVRRLRGKRVLINTGSRAKIDPVPGLKEAGALTHIEALELDHVPGHVIVIGGGYIGLELTQALRRFGSKVTVVERNEHLAHREDPDISEALHQLCTKEGIDVLTKAKIEQVEGKSGEAVKVKGTRDGASFTLEGTHLLVATGRTPNTGNIGLEQIGVELTGDGHVKVNEKLETTVPHVFALGDCAGSPHFTHIAFDDFRVIRDNFAGKTHVTTGRQVPFCLFTDPEFARVGLNETEARASGVAYRVAKIPMISVLRTRTLGETTGFLKVLVDNDDRILGFMAFGTGVGELLPAIQVVMTAGLPYTILRETVLTHPTLAEGFVPLLSAIPARKGAA